jgi:hypothetical protein
VDHGASELQVVRQRERTAAEHRVSSKAIRVVTEIARSDRTLVERIISGELTLKDAKRMVQTQARRERAESALRTNPRGSSIYTGDFLRLEKLVPDGTADLFLCDPPYDKSGVHVYRDLARLALAKLKPGRFCIVLVGRVFLPQIISMMCEHLDYYWLCGIRYDSRRPRVWSKRVQSGFRPILLFIKPPVPLKASHEWFCDFVQGNRDKDHHDWGQGVDGLKYFLERFTSPDELVVDPFCGGGPVPVACIATGRRYIATEIDPGVAAAARARVARFQKNKNAE